MLSIGERRSLGDRIIFEVVHPQRRMYYPVESCHPVPVVSLLDWAAASLLPVLVLPRLLCAGEGVGFHTQETARGSKEPWKRKV